MKDYNKELTGEQKIIIAFTDPLKKQIEKLTIENAKLKLQLLQTDVIKSVCGNCERKQLYIKKQCYCGYCGDRLKT